MFGTKHLLILAVCVAYIVGMILLIRFKKPSFRVSLRVLLGIGVISETLKVFSYVVQNEETYGGYLPKTDLPFHLCSVQIIFMLILTFSQSENLRRVLISFMLPTCLVGGIAALLIPTSSSLNMPVITVQYFLYHSSVIVYAVYLYMTEEIRFEFRDYLSTLVMLYAFLFVAIYLNSWVNDYSHPINFMYVVNPPADGLPFLNKEDGWLAYILRYMLLAFGVVTLCYIRPVIGWISGLFGKKRNAE